MQGLEVLRIPTPLQGGWEYYGVLYETRSELSLKERCQNGTSLPESSNSSAC